MSSSSSFNQLLIYCRSNHEPPLGTGIGEKLLAGSVFEFHGLTSVDGVTVKNAAKKGRVVEYIGASDSAGYCVEGTPDMDGLLICT